MKHFYNFVALVLIATTSAAQLPIAYYDFETNTHSSFNNGVKATVNTGSTPLSVSHGTISSNQGAGIANGGSQTGKAIVVYRGTTSSSTDPKNTADAYMQFNVNTNGFKDISMNWNVLANNNDAPYYGISISTNGNNWTWVGSVSTPGNGSFPWPNFWGFSYWDAGTCGFPSMADNANNLSIRIYYYWSTSNSANAHLRFDNVEILANNTVAGVNKTMLDDRELYTSATSGNTGSINSPLGIKRKAFNVSGSGTVITIPYLDLKGEDTTGALLNISNNATLITSSGENTFFVSGANGNTPASKINITGGGTLVLNNELQNDGIIHLDDGTLNLNGKKLLLRGTITRNNGLINGEQGTIEMAATTAAQTLSGAFFANRKLQNLVNNNKFGVNISAAANDTLKISGNLSFGNVNNATINTGNNLVLESNAAATATVADITNNGANSGNRIIGAAIVERYIPNAAKWRLLSIPANTNQTFKQSWQENAATANANPVAGYGILIGNNNASTYIANGFDTYTPNGPTVKYLNAATNAWVGISSTSALVKTAGGYMTYIRSNRSGGVSATKLRTKGELYSGTQAAISVPANQFAVVGNPYASAIDLRNVTTQGLQDVYYVWDPKAGGGYGLGAYQTLIRMGSDYLVFPGGGSYGAQLSVINNIESGLAFFVKAGAAGGSIQFTESCKADGSVNVFRTPEANSPMLRSTLYAVATDTTTLLDAAMVNIDPEFSIAVDSDDVKKLANGSENVSINKNGTLLLADRRPDFTGNDTIKLNLTGVRVQNYKWNISMDNMVVNGRTAFLVDAYTHIVTPLNMAGSTEYSFSIANIAGSYAANRFSIVFTPATVVLPVTITTVSAIRSTSNSSNVTVNWKVENETSLQNYEVEYSKDGNSFSTIATVNANAISGAASYTELHKEAAAADVFYRIKANSLSGQVQYSAIVRVNGSKATATAALSVYPNPVVNKTMNVQFTNQAEGTYSVKLISRNGATVLQTSTSVSGSNQIKMLQLNQSTAAGNYTLIVTGRDGNAQTTNIMVR